jgi:hypothetical protein
MVEFLILFTTLIVGIHWGWTAREAVAKKKTELLLSKLQEMEEEQPEDIIRITIEKDNGILFAYHEHDSLFIAQANSREELENKLRELFPGKRFGCSPENLKQCGFTL